MSKPINEMTFEEATYYYEDAIALLFSVQQHQGGLDADATYEAILEWAEADGITIVSDDKYRHVLGQHYREIIG